MRSLRRPHRLAILAIFGAGLCASTAAMADLVEDIDDLDVQPRVQNVPVSPVVQPTKPSGPGTSKNPANPSKNNQEQQPAVQQKSGKKSRSGKTQKVDFESDSLRALKDRRQIMLQGNVQITQGGFRLQADEATIYFNRKSREPQKVVAKGGVKIFQADTQSTSRMTAQSSEAVFFNPERKIILRGSAKLWHGDDFVSGKQITYELDTGWIKAERVEGVVLPGGKQ